MASAAGFEPAASRFVVWWIYPVDRTRRDGDMRGQPHFVKCIIPTGFTYRLSKDLGNGRAIGFSPKPGNVNLSEVLFQPFSRGYFQ